ncbi:MAG: hypothetical protein QS748_10745 [Candidatus Endonucleobacter bathymodioli]|uniref:Uncharacterized protein n=1 Tax=Candidatus Endonucleibacter bathymodioli TaxID=539814 RepID=A0AA90NMS8_9GAMM|nr:hypothetical protein [Candidatus Endonucleobacter bathymodioli]
MLFTENKCISSVGLLGVIVVISFLYGCSSRLNSHDLAEDGTSPYGEWFLLNPQDMQKDLVAGELFVCRKDVSKKGNITCDNNGFMMTFFEKDFGYGCTDFVSSGSVEFNKAEGYWYLVSDADPDEKPEMLKVVRDGSKLNLFQSNGTKLAFELSTSKDIEEKTSLSCGLSKDES